MANDKKSVIAEWFGMVLYESIPIVGLLTVLLLFCGFCYICSTTNFASSPSSVDIKTMYNMSESGSTERIGSSSSFNYMIKINAREFECSNQNITKGFNTEKAKFILSHELLHVYYKDNIFIPNLQRIILSFDRLQPLHKLEYVDASIDNRIIGSYSGTDKDIEKLVRTLNYCYYAQENNVSVEECELIGDNHEAFVMLDKAYQIPEIKEYIADPCNYVNMIVSTEVYS